jgi:hypothetical protein
MYAKTPKIGDLFQKEKMKGRVTETVKWCRMLRVVSAA